MKSISLLNYQLSFFFVIASCTDHWRTVFPSHLRKLRLQLPCWLLFEIGSVHDRHWRNGCNNSNQALSELEKICFFQLYIKSSTNDSMNYLYIIYGILFVGFDRKCLNQWCFQFTDVISIVSVQLVCFTS